MSKSVSLRNLGISWWLCLLWLLFAVEGVVSGAPGVLSYPFLPPLLVFNNGTAVTNAREWGGRRDEIKTLLEDYILGARPVDRPPILHSTVINTTKLDRGATSATSTYYRVVFDTSRGGGGVANVSMDMEILVPTNDKTLKPPLFMTQWNHRWWALTGLARGYVAVVYPGADTRDASPRFQAAYPGYSMKLIMARAFVASLALDFMHSGGFKFNAEQVCITGHSRNGKQSLIAAAFDDRITAVVGSSPGAPISSSYHLSSHNYYGEGPDAGRAGTWWLKRVTNFTAHPERLPMDGNGVLGLIAPRHAAVATGWTDHEGDDVFADEMGAASAMEVYNLLGVSSGMRIIHRPGDHHGFLSVHSYFDWFDVAFDRLPGRDTFPLAYTKTGEAGLSAGPFHPTTYLTPAGFQWSAWYAAFGASTPTAPPVTAKLTERINWLLQRDEPTVSMVGSTYSETGTWAESTRFSYRSVMMGTNYEEIYTGIQHQPVTFGDYLTAGVYWYAPSGDIQTGPPAGLPAIIWLHPYSYSVGYSPGYGEADVVVELAKAGFVVVAYDQVGFATRLREGGTTFYARHGSRASLFGHMVWDAQAAVDFLQCITVAERNHPSGDCSDGENHIGPYPDFLGTVPSIDPSKLFIAGYSLGGNVALHTAAIDTRITGGVASFAGFTPMRTDTNGKPTGGIQRLYDFHALLPRLGLFSKDPSKIPYDYDELISSIAPRPILLYTPTQDRDATFEDVLDCVDVARKAWKDDKFFNHTAPDTLTSMGAVETVALLDWAKQLL